MKQQTSFADLEYPARRKPTRREKFLTDLDRLVPWSQLVALIEPHYYRGERGRPPGRDRNGDAATAAHDHVGNEPLFDLRAVCKPCHASITKQDRGRREMRRAS